MTSTHVLLNLQELLQSAPACVVHLSEPRVAQELDEALAQLAFEYQPSNIKARALCAHALQPRRSCCVAQGWIRARGWWRRGMEGSWPRCQRHMRERICTIVRQVQGQVVCAEEPLRCGREMSHQTFLMTRAMAMQLGRTVQHRYALHVLCVHDT